MKKHFVFDFDDTLTNSYKNNQNLFVETFEPYYKDGIDKKAEEYLRDLHFKTRGKAMHEIFAEAIEYLKLDLDNLKLTAENEILHQTKYEGMTFFEGTDELLDILKSKGAKIYICTNRQYGSLQKILEKNKLTGYFDEVISCKDEGHEKPDPFCLTQLIEKVGADKSEFVYFGDSKVDYEFAEKAGIDFLIIDNYANKELLFKMLIEVFLKV
jgi:phosphoglycolate phosphatase